MDSVDLVDAVALTRALVDLDSTTGQEIRWAAGNGGKGGFC